MFFGVPEVLCLTNSRYNKLFGGSLHHNLLFSCHYLPIPDTNEIPEAKAVPQAQSQEPPPPAAPEQDSDSEDKEPSESVAQHLKPTPLSPPPSPKPVTTKQYPPQNRHTLHLSSQLTYATVRVPLYQPAIRVVQAVVPSPYQYNNNYY